jgi:hypothetical protein
VKVLDGAGRVTAGSHIPGTERSSAVTSGHGGAEIFTLGGAWRVREDLVGHAAETVRDREAPGSNSSSPWLYIQSEARQGVAAHLGPVESVHLKKIRGTPARPGLALVQSPSADRGPPTPSGCSQKDAANCG